MTTGNATSRSALEITLPSDREIVMTRAFEAPRELVFEAWTRPEHVKRWWGGCNETSLPLCEIDLRVGGAYRYVMLGPDGERYPFKGVYREIVPPERLVHTFVFDVEPYSGSEAIITVTFEERDGMTVMTETILHPSKEARDGHLQSGMEAGAASSLDRLAELLADGLRS